MQVKLSHAVTEELEDYPSMDFMLEDDYLFIEAGPTGDGAAEVTIETATLPLRVTVNGVTVFDDREAR